RELVLEILLLAEVVSLDATLEVLHLPLVLLEADERVVDLPVVETLAELEAIARRRVPHEQRLLLGLGVAELRLETTDVVVELDQALFDLLMLSAQAFRHGRDACLLGERRLGEVVTT